MALPSPSSSSEPLLARGDRTRDSWDDDAEALARDQDDDDVDVLHLDLADPDNDQPPPYNEKARSSKPPASPSSKRRRRYLIFATATVTAALVFTLFALLFFLPSDAESVAEVGSESTTYAPGSVEAEAEADHDVLAQNASTTTPPLYSPYVLGPPTDSFRDNIRNDTQYVTSWIAAGWTNDFMTYINLIYLASLSSRVALIPPFAPTHVGGSAGFIAFGDVFDIPRLSRDARVPLLEWRDLKTEDSPVHDDLACWSIWATVDRNSPVPRGNGMESKLNLDVAYTRVPEWTELLPNEPGDVHTSFWPLAALTYPSGRENAHLPEHADYPASNGFDALPEEQLTCFDFMYYVASTYTYEMFYEMSPAWRFVGKYAHFTQRMEDITSGMIRQTFGLSEGETIPPFISVHVRRGDFAAGCWQTNVTSECLAPLSAYATRVAEVRAELAATRGVQVQRVLVTSDEREESWWAEVRAMGWEWVDHVEMRTEEVYGRWYPVLIDAVIQSRGLGFVGTDTSTMSLMAQRRVEDWNGGAWREVRWGRLGADDHSPEEGEGENPGTGEKLKLKVRSEASTTRRRREGGPLMGLPMMRV